MRRANWLAAGVAILVFGCGGGSGPGGAQDTFVPADPGADAVEPPADEGQEQSREDTGPGFTGCVIAPIQDPELAVEVKKTKSAPIEAIVFQAKGGVGPDIAVEYKILGCHDAAGEDVETDAAIDPAMAVTNANGRVSALFKAGETFDQTCDVELSAECADPIVVKVHVYEYVPGCISGTFQYEGSLDKSTLKDIHVYVLDPGTGTGQLTCGNLFPEKPVPTDPIIADQTASNLAGTVQFEDLPADGRYLVYAVAKGPGGCPVASACTVVTNLPPGACEPVELEFTVANLVVAGCYDAVDHFDFTALIEQCAGGGTTIPKCIQGASDVGQTVCCAVNEIVKFFTTPGTTILETLEFFASQYFGSLIVGTLFDLFEKAAIKIIDDYVFNNSPQWVKDIVAVGQDITQVVTNLELTSTLCLGKLPGSSGELQVEGSQKFTGIAFYWQGVRYPFSLEQLKQTQFPMDIIDGHFVALIWKFNQMTINQHEIGLNYGKLVLFAINEIILKNVTGGQATTILDAAKLWINCKSIAAGILKDIASWFGGSQQDVENACNSTVDTLFSTVQTLIGNLSLPTTLQLTGSCRLVDSGCDLRVDELVDGKWSGTVTGSGTTPAGFTGDFSAKRQ